MWIVFWIIWYIIMMYLSAVQILIGVPIINPKWNLTRKEVIILSLFWPFTFGVVIGWWITISSKQLIEFFKNGK